jgi:hypothetical protein
MQAGPCLGLERVAVAAVVVRLDWAVLRQTPTEAAEASGARRTYLDRRLHTAAAAAAERGPMPAALGLVELAAAATVVLAAREGPVVRTDVAVAVVGHREAIPLGALADVAAMEL